MFTGIVETLGEVVSIEATGSNKHIWIKSDINAALTIDQSVAHEGVCLTVDQLADDQYRVTAIEETLKKTNLENWKPGDIVNLERCIKLDGRLDGHIVQGHVDATGVCVDKKMLDGSVEYTFQFPDEFAQLVIEKGSIAVNGTSLTAFNITKDQFTVAIIPYTYEHTSIHRVEVGTIINLEFDLIGKYILRSQRLNNISQ